MLGCNSNKIQTIISILKLMLSYVSKGHHGAKVHTRTTEIAVVALLIYKGFKTLGIRHRVEDTQIFSSDQLHVPVKASEYCRHGLSHIQQNFRNLSSPVRTEPIDCVGTPPHITNRKYIWIRYVIFFVNIIDNRICTKILRSWNLLR